MTALGIYDHGYVTAVERRPTPTTEGRLWHIRARRIVIATGATERPIVFADDDRPGIMLAGAAATYVERYGVRPGDRAVIFTNNGTTDAVAAAIAGRRRRARRDRRCARGRLVVGTNGDDAGRLTAVTIARAGGDHETVEADLLLVSGGWNPNVALWTHARGTLRFDERIAAFVPDKPGPTAGSRRSVPPPARSRASARSPRPGSCHHPGRRPVDAWATHYVDVGRDATVRDLQRALGAGLESIEHVKRYTTIGTGIEQGRSGGVVASAIAASILGQEVGAVGVPTFRPPTVPVSFAQLAARDRGAILADPVRTTPIQAWHVANGAVFEDVGQWKRPRFFPRDGESMDEAVLRECAAARTGVAVMDATTLGKIDIQGPDAGIFLDRVYTNMFSTLKVGSCRYGLMCRADGMVFDDGVTSRLSERPVPHDDDDRQRGARPRPPGGVAPDRVARAARPRHERHRAMDDGRGRGAARPRGRGHAHPGPRCLQRGVPVHDLARGGHRGHARSRVPHLVLRGARRSSSTSRPGTAWPSGKP